MFYLRGLMERIGRGGQLIINACQDHSLPAPKWIDRTNWRYAHDFWADRARGGIPVHPQSSPASLAYATRAWGTNCPGEYHQRFATEISDRQARRDLPELEEAGCSAHWQGCRNRFPANRPDMAGRQPDMIRTSVRSRSTRGEGT